MKRLLLLFALFWSLAAAHGSGTEFVGIFLNGQRIGYVATTTEDTPKGTKTDSISVFNAAILGAGMKMEIRSSTLAKAGKILTQEYTIESAGRSQKITATFGPKSIHAVRMSGADKFEKDIPIPAGAVILADATTGIAGKGLPAKGTKQSFYTLDPTLLALIKNDAEYLGPVEVQIDGKTVKAFGLKVTEPRATTTEYMNAKGEFLYATGILGMTMKPITREEALGNANYAPSIDIATATRVVPDKQISDSAKLKRLVLRIEGADLARLKSDYYQTATRDAAGIKLDVHPQQLDALGVQIGDKSLPRQFTLPSINIPSDAPEFKELAKTVLAGEAETQAAALKIAAYVHKVMKPRADVGMLRDTREIWQTKEGVCRDYSTLATTIMRAAGIPTKLITGSVYFDGAFYYHAWVEFYNGRKWIALDPTLSGGLADPGHIKFAEGGVEEAFISFTWENAKIKVLEEVPR